jgi:hypothetical protein
MADAENKTKRKPSLAGRPRKKENKKKKRDRGTSAAIDLLVEENPKEGLLTQLNLADANEEEEEETEKGSMVSKGNAKDNLTLPTTTMYSREDMYHFCMMSAEPLREVLRIQSYRSSVSLS